MSTQVHSFQPPKVKSKYASAHPLCALSGDEIAYTAELIRSRWPAHTDLRFKTITLDEPPKAQLLPYLQAEATGQQLPILDRKAFTAYYIRNTVSIFLSSMSLRYDCKNGMFEGSAFSPVLSHSAYVASFSGYALLLRYA